MLLVRNLIPTSTWAAQMASQLDLDFIIGPFLNFVSFSSGDVSADVGAFDTYLRQELTNNNFIGPSRMANV